MARGTDGGHVPREGDQVRKPEAQLWGTLKRGAGTDPHSLFVRHEDKYSSGIADVSFVLREVAPILPIRGWIELKRLREWPKRPATAVKIPHFTNEQRNWLIKQGRIGGNTWVLLQVERDYMLFAWQYARFLGTYRKDEMLELCSYHSKNTLGYDSFRSVLKGGT